MSNLLQIAAHSGLLGYLGRRETNTLIQVQSRLVSLDPHPGRLIHACNRRDVPRLRMLLESGKAPWGWPRLHYKVYGSRHEATNLFEAAKNAYCQEAALVAVAYIDKWTPGSAAWAIGELSHTSWTDVADALLAAGGEGTLDLVLQRTSFVLCHGDASMIRWYAAHGADLNGRCNMYGETALQHHVHFTNKDKVALLLSLGARPDAATITECFDRYNHYREEEPECSGDWDAMEILGMLIPYASSAMRTLHKGKTPLMHLVSEVWGRGDLLELMLKHGADPAQTDAQGRTALWWAERTLCYGVPCQAYVEALRR